MREFDYQKAKEGCALCLRNGYKCRILSTDRDKGDGYNIMVYLENVDTVLFYNKYGKCLLDQFDYDLMLRDEEEVWVNVYRSPSGAVWVGSSYSTEEEAKKNHDQNGYIKTIKIEL